MKALRCYNLQGTSALGILGCISQKGISFLTFFCYGMAHQQFGKVMMFLLLRNLPIAKFGEINYYVSHIYTINETMLLNRTS